MRVPHFLTLVQIDRMHSISACRTGIVHVTWARATIRLDREELRKLGWLLERVADIPPPTSLREGDLSVTHVPGTESQVRIGPAALLLQPDEFALFADAVREAVERLDDILSSGAWNPPDDDQMPPTTLDPTGRTSFSPS